MKFFRRLVARSGTMQPRLAARRTSQFAESDVRIEECEEDVLVPSREPARAAVAAAPFVSQAARGDAPDAPDARVAAIPNAAPQADVKENVPPRRAAMLATPAPVEPQRGRRVRRVSRIVERMRAPGSLQDVETSAASDDLPLLAVANDAPPLRGIRLRPRDEGAVDREPPLVWERAAQEPSSTTVVNVAIGRIEVRAATGAAANQVRPEPFRPRVTLEAHLARGSGSR
jgi:hypothetical protein